MKLTIPTILADRRSITACAPIPRRVRRTVERRSGSGMRGDKRRTVRVQDDTVVDHLTGRMWRYRDYARGAW